MRKWLIGLLLLCLAGCARQTSEEPAAPAGETAVGEPSATETPAVGEPSATETPAADTAAQPLAGKKVVMIIAHKDFRDEELAEPQKILEERGAKVAVASSSMEKATGMKGARVSPDVLLENVDAADFDAVVFIGGQGASEYWNSDQAHQIAQEAVQAGKVVAAICLAPVTLAKAGLLKGKKATVWASESKTLEEEGATYTGAPVEIDGNLITGSGPEAAQEFGEAVAEEIRKLGN